MIIKYSIMLNNEIYYLSYSVNNNSKLEIYKNVLQKNEYIRIKNIKILFRKLRKPLYFIMEEIVEYYNNTICYITSLIREKVIERYIDYKTNDIKYIVKPNLKKIIDTVMWINGNFDIHFLKKYGLGNKYIFIGKNCNFDRYSISPVDYKRIIGPK
jgi:hypothetical protein